MAAWPRSGARQLINQAVEAELGELLSQYSEQRTDASKLFWFAMTSYLSSDLKQV
jgi:hypothetical protein